MEDALDVLLLVVISHLNISPIGLQVNGLDLSKALVFRGECRLYDTCDIVLSVEMVSYSLRLFQRNRLTESRSKSGGNQHLHPPCLQEQPFSARSSCKKRR